MMYFYRRFFIFAFIFVLFSAFFLQKKTSPVQAACQIVCAQPQGCSAPPCPMLAPGACISVCTPDPTVVPGGGGTKYKIKTCSQHPTCPTTCGRAYQCISDPCGGQICCSATAACPLASTPTPIKTPTPIQSPTPTPNPCLKQPQGDANCDGTINDADFLVLKSIMKGLGATCTSCSADFNKDGKTNVIDYEIWRNSFYQ